MEAVLKKWTTQCGGGERDPSRLGSPALCDVVAVALVALRMTMPFNKVKVFKSRFEFLEHTLL